MPFRKFSIAIAFLMLTSFHNGYAQIDIPPEKPKLIVQIVVSQMRYDYLQRFSTKFSEDGFTQLLSEGASCQNANFNHLLTQSSPGLATIYTGAYPSVHGIIADSWYSVQKGSLVNALQDENVASIGGSYYSGKFSPKNLITSTIGDELRIVNPRSKVVSVGLEAPSAIIAGGHFGNAAYWLDVERGNWVSNAYYVDSLPNWVDSLNAKGYGNLYLNKEWALSNDLSSYYESDTVAIKSEKEKLRLRKKLSALVRGVIRAKQTSKNFAPILQTPFGNTYTWDMAIQAIVGEELGKDDNTDILSIVFTPTRVIGEKYGPYSIELEDTYLRFDKELAHFIKFLNYEIGRHNYLLVVTSDQGVAPSMDHLGQTKYPGGYFEPPQAMVLLQSYLRVVYGQGNWISEYSGKQIYLNRRLIEDSNLPLHEFQDRVANFMVQFSGVANAVSAHTLQSNNFTSGIYQKFQNSYNQRRSGDVIINLEPGWIERSEAVASANSPYNYDTHVPLIWYGWRIKRKSILTPVCMTDIAPTLSTFLGINWPNGAFGVPILKVIE